MPAELFRPSVASTPSRRRVSLLPISLIAHGLGISVFIIAPLMAEVELPPPNRPASMPYIPVKLPTIPPAPRVPNPSPARSVAQATSPLLPPVEAPSRIEPEATLEPTPITGNEFGPPTGIEDGADWVKLPEKAPPPPPKPHEPVRPGGQIEAPKKIKDVPPVYPAIAQASRVQGVVILEALIGVDGRVNDVRVLRSHPLLDQAAIDAVKQWMFKPTKLNGEPVPVVMTVTVDFRLQ
jgi:periplasmic protein TonB